MSIWDPEPFTVFPIINIASPDLAVSSVLTSDGKAVLAVNRHRYLDIILPEYLNHHQLPGKMITDGTTAIWL